MAAKSQNKSNQNEPLTRAIVKSLTKQRLDSIWKSAKRRLLELNKKHESLQARIDKRRKTGQGGNLGKLIKDSDKVMSQIRRCRNDVQLAGDEREIRHLQSDNRSKYEQKKMERRKKAA